MDLKNFGLVVKTKRIEKKMSRGTLAKKIRVTFQTIEDWENGVSYPKNTQLIMLCKVLNIDFNKYVKNCKKDIYDYIEEADEYLIQTLIEKKQNRNMIFFQISLASILIVSLTFIFFFLCFSNTSLLVKILSAIAAALLFVLGVGTLCVMDINTGYYECENCYSRFTPSFTSYFFAPHSVTRRRLACPCCKKKKYHKKVMNKKG